MASEEPLDRALAFKTQLEKLGANNKKALAAAGKLDVVVNNAGVGTIGLQESFTSDDWRRLFDVNVFGMQRVDRAVLPHMREIGSGLLIHISSLLGRMILPFYGPYNASKWAVEALSETYRVELSGLGIDVCMIAPGGYPTTFMENLIKPGDPSREAGYGKLAKAPGQMFESFKQALKAAPAQKPQNVPDAIARLINTPAGQRPGRTVVDTMGMGDPIKGYNEQLDRITAGTYGAFGMENMLKVKVTADV